MPVARRNRRGRCNKSAIRGQGRKGGDLAILPGSTPLAESATADDFRQHLLDFDRNPVAIDQHDTRRNRQRVGEDLDFVGFGGVEFDDGAAGKPHDLMNRHRGGSENHHEVDADFIEGWHRTDYHTDKSKIAYSKITTLWLADG